MSHAKAEELSGLFYECGWTPSVQNFKPRPFVMWHGQWFTVAGSPHGRDSYSKSCQTEAEVIAFLAETGGIPNEPDSELFDEDGYDAHENTEVYLPPPDPRDEEIIRLREQLASTVDELDRVVETMKAQAAQISEQPPEPSDGIPDEFRALMMEGESAERFTERMRRRWQALQHLRIDGTKPTQARALPDMTPEESEELADLEARNSQRKWLD